MSYTVDNKSKSDVVSVLRKHVLHHEQDGDVSLWVGNETHVFDDGVVSVVAWPFSEKHPINPNYAFWYWIDDEGCVVHSNAPLPDEDARNYYTDVKKNYYMINMQKVLFIACELHKRGYEKLRVVPSVAPTGLAWRCQFVAFSYGKKHEFIASNWVSRFSYFDDKEIKYSTPKLADIFEEENTDFLAICKGESREYVEWFSGLVSQLREGELPYAFEDYGSYYAEGFWKTSKGNKIKMLPDDDSINMFFGAS